MAGKGVSTDGMRRPALSGPESEISREWAEYVVRQASGRNTVTGEFGIPRAPLAFPPLDVGTATPPFSVLCADPTQTDLVSRTSPESSKSPSVRNGTCPERIRRCVLLQKENAYFDRISFCTHTPHCPFAIVARGVGGLCVCAVLAQSVFSGCHRFKGVRPMSESVHSPLFIPSPRVPISQGQA
jgi:hypothetical protein